MIPLPILYFLLLIMLIGYSSCQSEEEYHDLKEMQLKGGVKSVSIQRYRAVWQDGKVVKGARVSRSLDRTHSHEYESLPTNTRVEFNRQKERVSLYFYNRGGALERYALFSDSVFVMHTAEGKVMAKVRVNDRLFPDSMLVYNQQDELINKTLVEYQWKQGQRAIHIHREYNAADSLIAVTQYEYDRQGRLIVVERHVEQPNYHRQRQEHSLESIAYNTHNHPIKVTIEEGNRTDIITVNYQLDAYGNWVQAVEYLHDKPYQIVERKIVYYD